MPECMAITSTQPDLMGKVPEMFAGSPYLLIIDAETGELLHSEAFGAGKEVDMARRVLEWKCESIICGPMEQPPFDVVALEGHVTRFDGADMPIAEALARLHVHELEYIKDFVGGAGCPSTHEEHAKLCDHVHDDDDHGHGHDHGHAHHHHN